MLITCSFALASDNSPLQDFCVADPNGPVLVNGFPCKDAKLVQANDFFLSGLHLMGNTSNAVGSRVTPVTVAQLPGLNTLGISMARIDFAPWGINPPHTHPRATEILTVIEGSIQVGRSRSLSEEYWICNAIAIVGLSSQNPGVITIANAVFGAKPDIPSDLLAKAFQVDVKVVDQIQSKF
ncbi:hypothetical protein L1987_65636 [Smallanthus sonchifolius]|uniref:Uncharacterized protein n=1 Tax=Smallanthus sonchifolius TaxID=185202 RepID=A0ACB9BV12_9ASTR|nr:hypothetical protein L1987_65636 [Smallanthus sonchifolius]